MSKVVIYTSSSCPYCLRAKALLQRKNAQFEEINIENDQQLREKMIQQAGGRKTVPQIFINDIHVGGSDDLYALEQEGQLQKLLDNNFEILEKILS
ncbi:Glutaredoxin-3 [Candidatus Trichorickettsia mobilis]|uniref:Glutaredoxin n=1 Tax=Candidatus Trichorickettsia mobilis TaxID=1346319 RepID=A0ABZ0UTB5_9RICK|nr:glutaredoxin 3 [Candidatus Trichorickettsia mobilis]WPY01275.1 Glutaredoxin-3 [Candidatus Trichorickettsia mobilis]